MKFNTTILICFFTASFNASAQSDSLRINLLKKNLLTEKDDANKVKNFYCYWFRI